jgi:hypothetical protein
MTFAVDEFQVHEIDGVPSVELPFAVPLGEITLPESTTFFSKIYQTTEVTSIDLSHVPVVWIGKIDGVIIHKGEYWVMDHKTTSIMGPTYYDQYYMSGQMIGYTWALQKLLNIPIRGVLINVFGVRKPTKTGKGTEFGRQFISYEQHLINEWQVNTLSLIGQFFANLAAESFPKRTTQCIRYMRKCAYWDVCNLPAEHRPALLYSNNFKQITWSPLNEE